MNYTRFLFGFVFVALAIHIAASDSETTTKPTKPPKTTALRTTRQPTTRPSKPPPTRRVVNVTANTRPGNASVTKPWKISTQNRTATTAAVSPRPQPTRSTSVGMTSTTPSLDDRMAGHHHGGPIQWTTTNEALTVALVTEHQHHLKHRQTTAGLHEPQHHQHHQSTTESVRASLEFPTTPYQTQPAVGHHHHHRTGPATNTSTVDPSGAQSHQHQQHQHQHTQHQHQHQHGGAAATTTRPGHVKSAASLDHSASSSHVRSGAAPTSGFFLPGSSSISSRQQPIVVVFRWLWPLLIATALAAGIKAVSP